MKYCVAVILVKFWKSEESMLVYKLMFNYDFCKNT